MNISHTARSYDLFVSFAGPDRVTVHPIIKALTDQRLTLFVDERSIEVHEEISRKIEDGLAHSAALLAFYTRTYPTRLACQRELTAAFLAAKNEGDVGARILVVNPERGVDHIEPVELRDLKYLKYRPTTTPHELRRWAVDVAARIRGLQDPLGSLSPIDRQPRWWPAWPVTRSFIGRYPELWRLHSALHAPDFPYIERAGSVGLATLHGLAGVGKTALAEKYAIEFGAAFPGGVIWTSFPTSDESADEGEMPPLAGYHAQLREIASWTGAPSRGAPADRLALILADHFSRLGQPCLWVIDNVPAGMTEEKVRELLVPSPRVRSILITHGGPTAELGVSVPLAGLSRDEALQFLTEQYDVDDLVEARGLIEDLGGHPLALRVAGRSLREEHGLTSTADYRQRIHSDIPSVIADSIDGLGEAALSILRIAALLASVQIPVSVLSHALQKIHEPARENGLSYFKRALRELDQKSLIAQQHGSAFVHPVVLKVIPPGDYRVECNAVGAALVAYIGRPGIEPTVSQHVRRIISNPALAEVHAVALLRWLATTDAAAGDYLSAGCTGRLLTELLLRCPSHDSEQVAVAALAAAEAFTAAGEYASVIPLAQQALSSCTHDNEWAMRGEQVFAKALDGLGRFTEAEAHWAAALALSPSREESADGLRINWARALRLRGRLDEAEAKLSEVGDPELAMQHVEQAVLHQMRGRPVLAKRAAERAVARYRALGLEEDPESLRAAGLIVDAELMINQRKPNPFSGGERKPLEKLHAICELYVQQYGSHSPLTLAAVVHYGIELAGWYPPPAGQRILEAAERESRIRLGEQNPHRLRALYGLSTAAMRSGEYESSLKLAEQAHEGQRKVLGEQHPDTLYSLLQMGIARSMVYGDEVATRMQDRAYTGLRANLGWRNPEVMRAWISRGLSRTPAPVLREFSRLSSGISDRLSPKEYKNYIAGFFDDK